MRDKIIDTLRFYCENEMQDFKASDIFINLQKIIKGLDFHLSCEVGKELNNTKSNNIYLSLSVYKNNNIVEILDDGYLTASTMIVEIDKQEKIKFFSWKDNDFLESINWIEKSLKLLHKK